jgi:hypothetical protein
MPEVLLEMLASQGKNQNVNMQWKVGFMDLHPPLI